jgi:hypothetical protein
VRTDCAKSLAEVEGSIATVVVHARDAEGRDVVAVKVQMDGQPLLEKLEGVAVAVDPGPHKLRYEFPNGNVVEDDVLITEGEKRRMLSVALKKEQAPVAPAIEPSRGPGPAPWIIGGVGLAALVGFGLMEIPIQSQYSSLTDGCGKTQSCTQAQKDSLTSLYAPAAILLGAGILGASVGATWLIVSAVTHGKTVTGSFITPVAGGAFAGYARAFY